MKELAIWLFRLLVNLAIWQIPFTLAFVWLLRRRRSGKLLVDYLPKASAILCLREANHLLPDCLQALLQQNYPHYDIRIVIDNQEDLARSIATQTIQNLAADRIKVSPLKVQHETCSFQCSALLQAVSELDDDCEVIALLDAETIPHPNWLREIVAPLAERKVGLTTGNCWYSPSKGQWGSLLQYLWNVAAVVQMYVHKIPWGGSLAMKTALLRQTPILETWQQSLSADVVLYRLLSKSGLQTRFVPSAILVNRQGSNLPNAIDWIKRQLVLVRLYHPRWWAIVVYGIFNTVIPVLTGFLLLISLLIGQWQAAASLGSGFVVYILAMFLLINILEQGVQRIIRARREPTKKLSAFLLVKILLTIPLSPVIYAIALGSIPFIRHLKWRGITYRIAGPWKIRLVSITPPRTFRIAEMTSETLSS